MRITLKLSSLSLTSHPSGDDNGTSQIDAEVQYKFRFEGRAGAVAIVAAPAVEEKVADQSILPHIAAHRQSWLAYARSAMDEEVRAADLVFVTGHLKTSDWAIASFVKDSRSEAVQFSFGRSGPYGTFNMLPGSEGSSGCAIDTRVAARSVPGTEASRPDQCLFIDYYRLGDHPVLRQVYTPRPQDADSRNVSPRGWGKFPHFMGDLIARLSPAISHLTCGVVPVMVPQVGWFHHDVNRLVLTHR